MCDTEDDQLLQYVMVDKLSSQEFIAAMPYLTGSYHLQKYVHVFDRAKHLNIPNVHCNERVESYLSSTTMRSSMH